MCKRLKFGGGDNAVRRSDLAILQRQTASHLRRVALHMRLFQKARYVLEPILCELFYIN